MSDQSDTAALTSGLFFTGSDRDRTAEWLRTGFNHKEGRRVFGLAEQVDSAMETALEKPGIESEADVYRTLREEATEFTEAPDYAQRAEEYGAAKDLLAQAEVDQQKARFIDRGVLTPIVEKFEQDAKTAAARKEITTLFSFDDDVSYLMEIQEGDETTAVSLYAPVSEASAGSSNTSRQISEVIRTAITLVDIDDLTLEEPTYDELVTIYRGSIPKNGQSSQLRTALAEALEIAAPESALYTMGIRFRLVPFQYGHAPPVPEIQGHASDPVPELPIPHDADEPEPSADKTLPPYQASGDATYEALSRRLRQLGVYCTGDASQYVDKGTEYQLPDEPVGAISASILLSFVGQGEEDEIEFVSKTQGGIFSRYAALVRSMGDGTHDRYLASTGLAGLCLTGLQNSNYLTKDKTEYSINPDYLEWQEPPS